MIHLSVFKLPKLNKKIHVCNKPGIMDVASETIYTEDTLAFQKDVISALNECQTKKARQLCIFELASKCNDQNYHIGSTYTESTPELSFYYTISTGLFNCTILNIFACHRSEGTFIIGISASNKVSIVDSNGKENHYYVFLQNQFKYKTFQTKVQDESHHIKSFCFSKDDLDVISDKGLCIPIEIDMNPQSPLDVEVVQRLKANHDLASLLKKEKNYTLISASGKKYDTNKLVLVAHSQVLREKIKNVESDTVQLNIDDDKMDLLQEYLLTGTIENASSKNYSLIFEVAEEFQLENLKLIQNVIIDQISIDNAIDFFVLSDKFKLETLQDKIFTFVKENPAVLESEAWKNLKDLALTKKILKVM